MADLVNTGNKNTLLDNNLVVSSESVPATRVLVVDSANNRVGINKAAPAAALDIVGSTAISSTLAVQTNKLIVDSSGNVGINVTPSGTYKLEVTGDVSINGSLVVTGSFIRFDATSLEVNDANILLNKGGNDASASGAGLTIQRTTTNALLTWNNTKSNFEAGLSSGATSLIRAGGNTDAAAISIGTSDAFGFNLRTNNTDRVQISTSGNTTLANNLTLSINGTLTNQTINLKDNLVPPAVVLAFMPGYFQNSSNGTFTANLGGNTVSAVNTWLTTNGYSQWRVCDGTNYGTNGTPIPGSPIFGGTNRFVPNLTDARFIHGNNTVDTVSGTNDGSHTHPVPNALTGIDVSHTHSAVANGALTPGSGTSGATGSNTASSSSTSTGYIDQGSSPVTRNLDHTHGGSYPHFHSAAVVPGSAPNGNLYVAFTFLPGSPSGTFVVDSEISTPSWTSTTLIPNLFAYISYTSSTPGGIAMTGDATSTSAPLGATSPSLASFSFDHTHSVPSHTHPLQAHTHDVSSHNHSGGPHAHSTASPGTTTWNVGGPFNTQFSHAHTITAQTGPGAEFQGTENRPQYLSCFYIMRVV